MNLAKTDEIFSNKVSVVELNGRRRKTIGRITGLEYAPPRRGVPYSIYNMGSKRVFQTSPVKDIRETYTTTLIKTVNTIYQIKYLDE
jgi:hypothetical protein